MSGTAALLRPPPRWDGLQWPGARVVILASGQSLSVEQCEAVHAWRFAGGAEMRRVIAINTTFQRAPWADLLWGCDLTWWRQYHKEAAAIFTGQLWTQDQQAVREFGLHFIESAMVPGLSRRPGVIHQGGNSAYMSVNLGVQAGAKRFVLLGVDMHGTHWHGNHPAGLPNPVPNLFKSWIKQFGVLAKDLEREGIEVINCTPGTALHCFPERALEEALR